MFIIMFDIKLYDYVLRELQNNNAQWILLNYIVEYQEGLVQILKKNFPETSNYEQLLVCGKFGFVHDWNQFVEWLIVWNMNDLSFLTIQDKLSIGECILKTALKFCKYNRY